MYAAIRTYETIDAGEVTRRANRGFVPILRGTPGFIAYYIVDGGDGKLASISVFEEQAGAEESTRRAAEWVADVLVLDAAGLPIPYSEEAVIDPKPVSSGGDLHVVRGGSFADGSMWLRTAARHTSSPRSPSVGFRCASDVR